MIERTSILLAPEARRSAAEEQDAKKIISKPKDSAGLSGKDTYKTAEMTSSQTISSDILKLDLPSRNSFKLGMEDRLSYFIGSNCLDTHVQMYAEIESEAIETIATIHRDEQNLIRTYFNPQSSSSSWYFSRESLAEVIEEAKNEIKGFADLKEPREN